MKFNGCETVVFSPDEPPNHFDYLEGFSLIQRSSDGQIQELVSQGFRIIVVDSSSPIRSGISSFPEGSNPLVIDHHPSVEDHNQQILVDTKRSSTAELIFDLIGEAELELNNDCAEAIFTGIITDTGSFKYPNVTPKTWEIVSKLVKKGLDTSKVSSLIYERMTYANRKLLGRTLERLSLTIDNKVAITAITWKDMTDFDAVHRDTDFIIDEIRKLGGCEIYVLAKEFRPDQFKISMRGRGQVNLSELAQKFGGGGHHDASGFNITGDWLFVRSSLLQIFESIFER
jgi:phosphoesterase RecJ-like protein